MSLHAGSAWDEGSLALIDQADVFQLFWSSHFMRSPYVRREWEYAPQLGRPNFVRPTYWEEPLPSRTEPVLPPSSLLALHFHHLGRGPDAPAAAGAVKGCRRRPPLSPLHRRRSLLPRPPHSCLGSPGSSGTREGEHAAAALCSRARDADQHRVGTAELRGTGEGGQGAGEVAVARRRCSSCRRRSIGGALSLSDSATAPPPVSTSSGSPAATLEPSPGAVTVVSMQVKGATVVSGSSTPTPGGSTTVFASPRGTRLRVVLTFARAATKQRVQAAAELRCRNAAGKWLVSGPKTEVVDIAAQPASRPDARTIWQSPWMIVPTGCAVGTTSGQGDGFIIGGVPSVDSGERSELVVAGLRVL